MLLHGVRVVLVNTRFPENVGMAVRACANMGCSELTLVTPEMWIPEKAAPLATAKGAPLLSRVKVVSSLAEAIGDCHLILATTARTGGWRKALQ
ncbi:MAG: TrmH family RNA methyltransferase, partial [Desulfovibrio sp.]